MHGKAEMPDNWHEERRKGIGGSDVAPILGLSPWKSAMDVWLEKVGLVHDSPVSDSQQFLFDLGHDLEPVIATCYTRRTGRALMPSVTRICQHTPILRGNPDRLVIGETRGVELKSETQFSNKFGEPGTDEVPAHYLVQCAHYMAITGIPVWDIALLRGGSSFSIYTIERDLELEQALVDQLTKWWMRHVVGKVPPDIDNSGAWDVYLAKKYPRDILPVRDADHDALKLIHNLIHCRYALTSYEAVEQELKTRVKFLIGDHEGIEGDFGKITWKRTKDSRKVDWEAAFKFLASASEITEKQAEAIIKANTDTLRGNRRFIVHEKEGWNYGRTIDEGGGLPDDAHTLQAGDRAGAAETPERGQNGADRAHELPQGPETKPL